MKWNDELKVTDVQCVLLKSLGENMKQSRLLIEHHVVPEEEQCQRLYYYLKQMILLCCDLGFFDRNYVDEKQDELATISLRINDYGYFVDSLIEGLWRALADDSNV